MNLAQVLEQRNAGTVTVESFFADPKKTKAFPHKSGGSYKLVNPDGVEAICLESILDDVIENLDDKYRVSNVSPTNGRRWIIEKNNSNDWSDASYQ